MWVRIAAGRHFFTDVVFAGVFMFLLAWVVHGLIYRWRPTRLTDKAIERPLEWAAGAVRDALAALRGGPRDARASALEAYKRPARPDLLASLPCPPIARAGFAQPCLCTQDFPMAKKGTEAGSSKPVARLST